jgi:predicted nucleic acid-binding protein
MVDALVRAGFRNAQDIADADAAEIASVLDLDAGEAEKVVEAADAVVGALIMEEAKARRGSGDERAEAE